MVLKKEEVTGGWRQRYKELSYLYSLPSTIRSYIKENELG
jgi:hypothetical protein